MAQKRRFSLPVVIVARRAVDAGAALLALVLQTPRVDLDPFLLQTDAFRC